MLYPHQTRVDNLQASNLHVFGLRSLLRPFYNHSFSTRIRPLEHEIDHFVEDAGTLTIPFEFSADFTAKPAELLSSPWFDELDQIYQKRDDYDVEFVRTYAFSSVSRAQWERCERWLQQR
jgi:hypothetical protein